MAAPFLSQERRRGEKMDNKEAQFKKMTEEPGSRLILSLAVPTIISMMVTAIYNTADTYFVSQLGTSASGAVGIVMSLMGIIQSSGFLIGCLLYTSPSPRD